MAPEGAIVTAEDCAQSVRQVDGPYFVGLTSHDQMTVFAVVFQLGVSVTVMPEVPMMLASAPVIAIEPVMATAAWLVPTPMF